MILSVAELCLALLMIVMASFLLFFFVGRSNGFRRGLMFVFLSIIVSGVVFFLRGIDGVVTPGMLTFPWLRGEEVVILREVLLTLGMGMAIRSVKSSANGKD